MPVSRKRRPALRLGRPTLTAAVVPTRRQRITYFETTTAELRFAHLESANVVIAKQVVNERSNGLIARAYEALTLSPLCVDAYAALSGETRDPDQSTDYLDRAIHAGELATHGLDPTQEKFWHNTESRPYLHARIARAERLLDTDEMAGVAELRAVVAFDLLDRVGARIPLLQALLNQDDVQPARALLDAFPDDQSVDWLYGRLLVGYRQEERAGPAVLARMRDALAANPHVPAVFAGGDFEDHWPFEPGSPEEAGHYDVVYGARWDEEPGAIEWLISLAAATT